MSHTIFRSAWFWRTALICLSVILILFAAFPHVFACIWNTRGAMLEHDPPPTDVRPDATTSDVDIVLFQEQREVCQATVIDVDIDTPGRYYAGSLPSGAAPVRANALVNTYFIHADIDPATPTPVILRGGVVFDEPIVGIIVSDGLLDASDVIGHPAVTYPTGYALRGLNISGNDVVNFVDQFTVLVELPVYGVTDQIRIVTAAMNHFKVYRLKEPQDAGYMVRLKGQFDSNYKGAILSKYTHFANPVAKNNCSSPYPWGHYKWYILTQAVEEPARTVNIENQFGTATLVIGQPRFLMVPAAKKMTDVYTPTPDRLDHCKCYEVVEVVSDLPDVAPVSLADQWGSEQEVPVEQPRFFCVPVNKRYAGTTQRIHNPCEHFTVYDLERDIAEAGTFWAQDQFDEHEGDPDSSYFLCVPTLKK